MDLGFTVGPAECVIRHAAFILFFSLFFIFFLIIFGFERYEKRAGDLNEPMRYLPCALLQCTIWDYGGFSISIYYYQLFSLLLGVTMRRCEPPGVVKWGNDTASRCRFPIFYSRNFEVKNRRMEGQRERERERERERKKHGESNFPRHWETIIIPGAGVPYLSPIMNFWWHSH